MQQRRYITSERSSQKDVHRPAYENLTLSSHSETNIPSQLPRYGSPNHLMIPQTHNRMKYSDVPRSPTSSGIISRQDHVRGNIVRRKNEGVVSNLKSQLQNLKMEVSRIMNKEEGGNNNNFSSRISGTHSVNDDYEVGENLVLRDYGKDVSDSVSVTSEKIIDQPIRRLEIQYGGEGYDHAHYMELQNNLLKTQLRNLKNKYNATKQQLRQKCEALQKKNQYLQISLKRSESSLYECKKNLQNQIQTIRFQLSRKVQQQIQQDQKKNEKLIYPERDTTGSNQLIQQKMKKLYEQLNEKTRTIKNMSIDYNDMKGEIERKSFQLKKQIQKNGQLFKQLQFAKRQNSRNQNLLEQQVTKKSQLQKNIEVLKEKNNQLSHQLHIKNQIVNNSQNFENTVSIELQNYKVLQQRLANENFELQNQIRKLRQLSITNQQEIKHLKTTLAQFSAQIDQLSRNIRIQREKNIQIEQNYRRMIDEIKQNDQRQLEQLRQEFENHRQYDEVANVQKQQDFKEQVGSDLKDKERQISKWKAEYKLLKLKYEENFALESSKKEEIQTYYRNYKEYKTKNKVLEMRNKVLEDSANQYIEKIQRLQSDFLSEKSNYISTINGLNMNIQQLDRIIGSQQAEINDLRESIKSQSQRANVQENYRRQIQQRVLNLEVQENYQIMQVIEKMKKRVNDQDQKINKMVKQMKNKDALISKLRQQIRDVLQSQQKELQNFRAKEIADIVHDIQSKTFVSFQELKNQSRKEIQIENHNNNQLINENAHLKGQIGQLSKQLIELRQQTKSISLLYNSKVSDLQQMQQKHDKQILLFEQKLEELQKIRQSQVKNLQTQLVAKNQENITQRNQIKNLNTTIIGMHRQTFDEALKNQIQAAKRLRDELNKKNEEVYRLRDSHANMKAEFDNLKSQSDINKLKFISQKKNLQVQFQVDAQQLKSQLLVEQKKVSSLQQKVKLVIDENKKKDTFIQSYIMNKKLPTNQKQLVAAFLKQYEICVTGKNISEKLQSQSQQLQKLTAYNFSLMKQIAQMKEKLLLYEATSIADSSQLRQNINDFESPNRKLLKAKSIPHHSNERP